MLFKLNKFHRICKNVFGISLSIVQTIEGLQLKLQSFYVCSLFIVHTIVCLWCRLRLFSITNFLKFEENLWTQYNQTQKELIQTSLRMLLIIPEGNHIILNNKEVGLFKIFSLTKIKGKENQRQYSYIIRQKLNIFFKTVFQ